MRQVSHQELRQNKEKYWTYDDGFAIREVSRFVDDAGRRFPVLVGPIQLDDGQVVDGARTGYFVIGMNGNFLDVEVFMLCLYLRVEVVFSDPNQNGTRIVLYSEKREMDLREVLTLTTPG